MHCVRTWLQQRRELHGTFCVLDEEKLIAEVKKDLANMTAFVGDDLENLGLYLRQNAKLGAFWDDWKRELNKLTNQVVNIVNKIIRLKDDIANLIRDVRKAIIALGKDLWALAQKCAAVISDLLDSIIPGVDSLVGRVKDALVCDLSATAQARLGESTSWRSRSETRSQSREKACGNILW